jgi:hypothetical protein
VKRVCANDSAGSRVKVGHRQAINSEKSPTGNCWGFFLSRDFKANILNCHLAVLTSAPAYFAAKLLKINSVQADSLLLLGNKSIDSRLFTCQ